jgi:hypothetical protein
LNRACEIRAPGRTRRSYAYAQLSPDGKSVALDIRDQQNDIWIWDLVRETLQRLTFDPGFNRDPVWAPDPRRWRSLGRWAAPKRSTGITRKFSEGFSAGSCSFRCILVQLGARSENAKPRRVSALHLHAFWCKRLGRILSPAHKATSQAAASTGCGNVSPH